MPTMLILMIQMFFVRCYNKDPYTTTALSKHNNHLEILKLVLNSLLPFIYLIATKSGA
jgi:hypothetical protein